MLNVKFTVIIILCFTCDFIICVNYCDICSTPGTHTLCKYVIPGPSKTCPGYDMQALLSADDIKQILTKINDRRNLIALGFANSTKLPTAANMRRIEWSEELAVIAQRWVDQCDQNTRPARHDECRDLEIVPVGQNIANMVGSAPGLQTKSLIDTWYMESLDYTGSVLYFNETVNSTAKSFTQLIWAETHSVGCGRAKFQTYHNELVQRLVCNFAPSGNIVGATVYSVGYPATQCPVRTAPDAEYPGLCSEIHVALSEISETTSQPESSLLRILNFPNTTENKTNLALESTEMTQEILQKIPDGRSSAPKSPKIRQISAYNHSNDYAQDYYEFASFHNSKSIPENSNPEKHRTETSKSPNKLLKQNFGPLDGYYSAMRYPSDHGQICDNLNPGDHKCTRRRLDATLPEHKCTRNFYKNDPCNNQHSCNHATTSTINDRVKQNNKHDCKKCIFCSRPLPTTTRHTTRCTCDQNCQCLDSTIPHECTSSECTQLHVASTTACSHETRSSMVTQEQHNHGGVLCTKNHKETQNGYRRFQGKVKNMKTFDDHVSGHNDYYDEIYPIVSSKNTGMTTSLLNDEYLEHNVEDSHKPKKKERNFRKPSKKNNKKDILNMSVIKPLSYEYFDYDRRKKRDTEAKFDEDYSDEYRQSAKKGQHKQFRKLKYTTLPDKHNQRTVSKLRKIQYTKSTEPITVRVVNERPIKDNHKEHLKEKFLSFEELMNLRRSNAQTDYIDHENYNTRRESGESKKEFGSGQFTLKPNRRADDPANTTTTTTTTVATTQPQNPKIRWCTRKHTCTWTAPDPGGESGTGANSNRLSQYPYGYVEGCTRTSTCTRINYERNKTPEKVKLVEAIDEQEYDEDCEERSLEATNHAHGEDDYIASHNAKRSLRSLDQRYRFILSRVANSVPDTSKVEVQYEKIAKPTNDDPEVEPVIISHTQDGKWENKRSKRNLRSDESVNRKEYKNVSESTILKQSGILSYGDIYYVVLNKLLTKLHTKRLSHNDNCHCQNKSISNSFSDKHFIYYIFISVYLILQ